MIKRQLPVLMLVTWMLLLSACSSGAAPTAAVPPRAPTQTPWIIYVVTTPTPEPATVTPLATVTTARPGRTPTKPAAPKPTLAPTKAPATPVAVVTQPTAPAAKPVPACSLGTVLPTFPEDGTVRRTKETGPGSDTFDFKWQVPASLDGSTDPQIGYRIDVTSKRPGFANGATIYISNNKFVQDGRHYIFDQRAVFSLAGGESVAVTWWVTIVKTSASFDASDPTRQPPGLIECGAPSQKMSIQLLVI